MTVQDRPSSPGSPDPFGSEETSSCASQMGLAAQFQLQTMLRQVDGATDLQALKGLTKKALSAWYIQKEAIRIQMEKSLPKSSTASTTNDN